MSTTFNVWLQSRLTSHGFPVGPIDGLIGPITIAALFAFQKDKNIPLTGRADLRTIDRLRNSSTADTPELSERNNPKPNDDDPNHHFPSQADVPSFYGEVGTNQTKVTLPWNMRLAWDQDIIVSRITLHSKVKDSAEEAFTRIMQHYGQDGIRALGLDLFGGSLNVRKMRGSARYSMHSWGIAIDFDPARNRLRWKAPKPRLSRQDAIPFWEIWESVGWVSLGRERNFDWMHVQAARL